ncbi:MAG TPA: ATP-binding protein [Candidatus Saccharimonadales bacterium]|nr:ATP-binding protein [Candidatus Saccharimonadales bacterium]
MVIDDFMFHVAKVWYRSYWALMVVLNTAILGGVAAAHFMPGFHHLGHSLNLDDGVTLLLSALTLGYLLTAYWIVARLGLALASIVGTMLNALVLLNGLNDTDPHRVGYVYVMAWFITVGLNGMYGIPLLLGSALVSAIYVLLRSDFHLTSTSAESWVFIIGALIVCGAAFPFWRTRFISREEQQMSKLSGMLKTNQEQSEILIQSIADGVIVTNNDGQITLMNRAAANMTGWTVDEATGVDVQLVLKVTRDDGSEMQENEYPFKSVLIHKAFTNEVLNITARSGKTVFVSLVLSPVVTADGKVFGAVGVLRDISEQRAAERQSADFISTASHEMRTPVAAIEGYLALALNDKVSTIDSRARDFLEKAHASTQHLGQLFQDLLTSAKAEDGRLTNHPGVVEMGSFLEQLVQDLRFSAEKKGLVAEFMIGASETIDATQQDATNQEPATGMKVVKPLYYVWADPDRLREVITNLFDNACKYTDAGKVSLGLTGNGDVVQFYIRDTGNGIPADDIPHLFQKFYRVDNSATRTVGGTGLGLFICRKIIELYHGRIWVESQLGKGSTFFINLPRLSTQRAAQMQQQQSSANAEPAPPLKSTAKN